VNPVMNVLARAASLPCLLLCLSGSSAPQATRQSDVIYGRKFGVGLTMEVFTPTRRNGIGVIWVVSSGGRSSREQTLQESFERRISPLLEGGYTVFAVIHGSAPVFNVQDFVSDVRRAVRFVRERSASLGVDGRRLGLAGSSSGGLVALMVAMEGEDGNAASEDAVERASARVQAVGCFFPPTDLTSYGSASENIVDLMQKRDGRVDPSFQFYDIDPKTGQRRPVAGHEDVLRMLREFSPVTHVSADDPPTILIHGDHDQAVPERQSRRMIERLIEVRVPARFVVREGMGHAYPGWESDAALIADWFDEHLRRGR
jgi:dipeptidyl aminopeptidase/acylaminoacyl peptidase